MQGYKLHQTPPITMRSVVQLTLLIVMSFVLAGAEEVAIVSQPLVSESAAKEPAPLTEEVKPDTLSEESPTSDSAAVMFMDMLFNDETSCTRCDCYNQRGSQGPRGPMGLPGEPGDIGPQGSCGDKGPDGPSGLRGDPGQCGPNGADGPTGWPGDPGPRGEEGRKGQRGNPGRDGPPGLTGGRGPAGPPGIKGADGKPGCPGSPGKDGKPGARGSDGCQGPPGPTGDRGEPGDMGPDGEMGPPGPPGEAGSHGETNCGPRGVTGDKGDTGPPGQPGKPGRKGPPGPDGKCGPDGGVGPEGPPGSDEPDRDISSCSAYVYAVHSQRTSIPLCPTNHVQIATGYSLLHLQDEGRAVGENLGTMGSCLPKFDPQPTMFCGANEVCSWGSRTISSYWLTTNQYELDHANDIEPNLEKPMGVVQNRPKLMQHISRCAVCMSPGTVMAFHSQSTQVPQCPQGNRFGTWVSLWEGYSFLMHAIGAAGVGQQLDSPGSCLRYHSHTPYVECDANRYCHYWPDYMMYWLYASDATFPNSTVKRGDVASRVGKCRVCAYQPANAFVCGAEQSN